MTDEQKADRIRALIEERRGYEARGLVERVEQVEQQLRALGAAGAPPARRASKRARS